MPRPEKSHPHAEEVRLQAFLAHSGVASRRAAEELIASGRVFVNGRSVTAPGTKIRPGVDQVEVEGQPVEVQPVTWIALNKPKGYVTTRLDPYGRKTVYELLPERFHGLFHVGRLDRDSEGLLLLTNDGELANRMLHPSYGVTKEYWADVEGKPTAETLHRITGGVESEGEIVQAESVRRLHQTGDNEHRLSVVMREGKKREVRRMLEAVGHPVARLIRRRFGPVSLGELKPGKWRMIADSELAGVRKGKRPTGRLHSGEDEASATDRGGERRPQRKPKLEERPGAGKPAANRRGVGKMADDRAGAGKTGEGRRGAGKTRDDRAGAERQADDRPRAGKKTGDQPRAGKSATASRPRASDLRAKARDEAHRKHRDDTKPRRTAQERDERPYQERGPVRRGPVKRGSAEAGDAAVRPPASPRGSAPRRGDDERPYQGRGPVRRGPAKRGSAEAGDAAARPPASSRGAAPRRGDDERGPSPRDASRGFPKSRKPSGDAFRGKPGKAPHQPAEGEREMESAYPSTRRGSAKPPPRGGADDERRGSAKRGAPDRPAGPGKRAAPDHAGPGTKRGPARPTRGRGDDAGARPHGRGEESPTRRGPTRRGDDDDYAGPRIRRPGPTRREGGDESGPRDRPVRRGDGPPPRGKGGGPRRGPGGAPRGRGGKGPGRGR